MRGKLIAFEGIDGSGKSTQIQRLAARLREKGESCHVTCEPTDGDIGRLLREYLSGAKKADDRVIAALFAADRLDHLTRADGICARLARGETVLVDRYYLSSYAYQGMNLPLEWVMALNAQSVQIQKPDCHIYLDLPVDAALTRIGARGAQTEIFETREKLAAIAAQYDTVISLLTPEERILRIDANRDAEAIAREISMLFFEL